MIHELRGVESTRKLEHNDHVGYCECGWTSPTIRFDNDLLSSNEAKRLVRKHIAEEEIGDNPS